MAFKYDEEYPEEIRLHLRAGIQEFRRLLDVASPRPTAIGIGAYTGYETFTVPSYPLPVAAQPRRKSAPTARHNPRKAASSGISFEGRRGRHPAGCTCSTHSKARGVTADKVDG